MEKLRIELIRDKVIGLRPVYTERGNATEVLLSDGEVKLDYRGIKTVKAALARNYAVDLQAQRKVIERELNRKAVVPFYLEDRVFIPLKMRQALTENDLVYGFIDVSYVTDIREEGKRRCRVFLSNGINIEVLSSINTALNSKHIGNKVAAGLQVKVQDDTAEKQVAKSVYKLVRSFSQILDRLERIEGQIAEDGGKY